MFPGPSDRLREWLPRRSPGAYITTVATLLPQSSVVISWPVDESSAAAGTRDERIGKSMETGDTFYIHPQRFPKNAPGPFYSLGDVGADGKWHGQCLSCTLPESEAPTLLAALNDENCDTYFVRQPETPEEVDAACAAAEVCCVSAIRYGGKDLAIIQRLGAEHCDFASLYGIGHIRPFRPGKKRWWQFWK
jgi:hypothetical protein